MRLGRCCASAGLEVRDCRALVPLQLSRGFLPALPPGPSVLCSPPSPPRPRLQLAVSNGSGSGRRRGALCGQTRPPLGTGLRVWRGARTRGAPRASGESGAGPPVGAGLGRGPRLCARDPLLGVRFLHPAPLSVMLICPKMGSCPHGIFYPAVSTI